MFCVDTILLEGISEEPEHTFWGVWNTLVEQGGYTTT